jgi:hypothetical protein
MACRHCRLEIPESLCQVCSYLEQEKFLELPAICVACGAPIAIRADLKDLCHVCRALLEVVNESGWFKLAHDEWEQENTRLANLKRELLQ